MPNFVGSERDLPLPNGQNMATAWCQPETKNDELSGGKFFENCLGQQMSRKQKCRTHGKVENNINLLIFSIFPFFFPSVNIVSRKLRKSSKGLKFIHVTAGPMIFQNIYLPIRYKSFHVIEVWFLQENVVLNVCSFLNSNLCIFYRRMLIFLKKIS